MQTAPTLEGKRKALQARYREIQSKPGGYDAEQETSHYSSMKAAFLADLLRRNGVGPNSRILEVGVGTGLMATPLARKGWNVMGVDVSREMLHGASLRKSRYHLENLHLAQADGFQLPFPDCTFDAAFAIQVLHLFPRPDRHLLIQEMMRVVRPGGLILVDFLQRLPHLWKWWRTRRKRPYRYEALQGIRQSLESVSHYRLCGGILPVVWKVQWYLYNNGFPPFFSFARLPLLRLMAHSQFVLIPKSNQ